MQPTSTTPHEPTLLGVRPALEAVFPDKNTRPSLRAWNEWRAKGFYSHLKIGKRVWIDPATARKELTKRFTIQAFDQ